MLAAEFEVNPGRIAEVLSGKRFPNAKSIASAATTGLTMERKENIMRRALGADREEPGEQNQPKFV
jgi:hypothetical protein